MKTPQAWREHRDVVVPALIISAAFAVVAVVWVLTGLWSFAEQRDSAQGFGFDHPAILFWSTDGFAVACALIGLSAAIDNRSAPFARLGVIAALSASAWFNAGGTIDRLGEAAPVRAVVMAAAIPIVSWLALEAMLLAIRATVRRWRGLPAPVGVPSLRLGRLLLAPWPSWCEWRQLYLDQTKPGALPVAIADDLRDHAAKLSHVNYLQTKALAERTAADLAALRAEIPDPPEPTRPEVTRDDLEQVRAVALRTGATAVDRAVELATEQAVDRAVTAARATAAETARAVAAENRSTGTTGANRTGANGARPGSKRDRYEQAYRSLVKGGTDPGSLTGNALAQFVTGDQNAKDDDGTGRRVLRDLRAEVSEGVVVPMDARERA